MEGNDFFEIYNNYMKDLIKKFHIKKEDDFRNRIAKLIKDRKEGMSEKEQMDWNVLFTEICLTFSTLTPEQLEEKFLKEVEDFSKLEIERE